MLVAASVLGGDSEVSARSALSIFSLVDTLSRNKRFR